MSAFYKMDPGAWDFGTAQLTLEQEAAYLRIVNAIHKHDQLVPNNDRVLAGMFRCSTRKARALVEALIEAGKIRFEGDRLANDRAVSDMVQREFVSSSRAESGAKGGRTKAERPGKALENNDTSVANASPRIEENRREEKAAAATRVAREPSESGEGSWTPDRLYDELVQAVGLTSGRLPTHWMPPAASIHAWRWVTDLGIPPERIVDAARQSRQRHAEAPNGPKALDRVMRGLAAALSAPAMTPQAQPIRPSAQAGQSQKSTAELMEIAMRQIEDEDRRIAEAKARRAS